MRILMIDKHKMNRICFFTLYFVKEIHESIFNLKPIYLFVNVIMVLTFINRDTYLI